MGRRTLGALGLLAVLSACQGDAAEEPSERMRELGPFLDAHWRLPVPPQGPAPEGWSEAEASLDPATCGACHPKQHAEWQGSLHAAAFSPGFSGQLVEGALAEAGQLRGCQTCHAPLSEQQPVGPSGETNSRFDPGLRAQGIVCAACHVRVHRRFGPPRRAEAAAPPDPVPHGGFEARTEYQESRFCAPCHQFFDDPGVNGKPVENTFREWQASPHAARGETCQSCHMPDRAHLWRGIHDPETVRAAVPAELFLLEAEAGEVAGTLVLSAEGVGHAFPSYVTPRVFLSIWQEGREGSAIAETRLGFTLGREIDFASDPWREVFDTRVGAGETVRLDYARPRAAGARALAARVTVDPDFHYRGVFAALEGAYAAPEARQRIGEAHRRSTRSAYVLHELRRRLP